MLTDILLSSNIYKCSLFHPFPCPLIHSLNYIFLHVVNIVFSFLSTIIDTPFRMDPPKILLVKKLPAELNPDERTDLLRHFGAISVSCMSSMGNMKGCAFAEFNNSEEASLAMSRLHQARIFNKRLVVEYSEKQYMPVEPPDPVKPSEPSAPAVTNIPLKSHEPDPSLHYLYPPPTPLTLNNISHALVAIPQFYVQVLHLMNKMNLPPPFGAPINQPVEEPPPLPSSEESELESDEEDKVPKPEVTTRVLPSKTSSKRKRIVSDPQTQLADCSQNLSEPPEKKDKNVESVVKAASSSLITHELPTVSAPPPVPKEPIIDPPPPPPITLPEEDISLEIQLNPTPATVPIVKERLPHDEVTVPIVEQASIVPAAKEAPPTPVAEFLLLTESEFEIHRRKISENIMPSEDRNQSAVFKKYSAGTPSNKLYLKNIHKNTTEAELAGLFEIYTCQEPCEGYEFSIKLMKEGRMKGQAFITFPSVSSAEQALGDLHGFVLNGKPLAVQFSKTTL